MELGQVSMEGGAPVVFIELLQLTSEAHRRRSRCWLWLLLWASHKIKAPWSPTKCKEGVCIGKMLVLVSLVRSNRVSNFVVVKNPPLVSSYQIATGAGRPWWSLSKCPPLPSSLPTNLLIGNDRQGPGGLKPEIRPWSWLYSCASVGIGKLGLIFCSLDQNEHGASLIVSGRGWLPIQSKTLENFRQMFE